MHDLEHSLRRVNEHLTRLRQRCRSSPLRCRERAALRTLEALASTAAKRVSEAQAAVDAALAFVHKQEASPQEVKPPESLQAERTGRM